MKTAKPAQLKKDTVRSWYRFRAFEKRGAIAAFSTRRFHMNFSEGRRDSLVVAHRKHFCKLAGVPFDHLVCLEQVHGANIHRLDKSNAGRGARSAQDAIPGTDAALTDSRDLVLSIRTADCAPLFFLDPVHRAIGVAHLGWRGASEQLASKMVQAFRRQYLTKPGDLIVAIGPAIRQCCYEVGSDFKQVFGPFVARRGGHFYFDLVRWAVDDLQAEGVELGRIYDCGFCTVCLPDQFPSYRKEGPRVSHMLSILKLE